MSIISQILQLFPKTEFIQTDLDSIDCGVDFKVSQNENKNKMVAFKSGGNVAV